MKVRVYIVTYRRDDVLNKNLQTLWAGARHSEDLLVTVLSNHPQVHIAEENIRPNLRVIINHTRHNNSWGYLARDWNFGIIDAFKTWKNPDAIDWCVLAQNDVEWLPGWDEWLESQTRFDLISQPVGDAVVALNVEAVRRVGLFDERFSTLHFHDVDYLNRAAVILRDRASINDCHYGDLDTYNPVGNVLIQSSATGFVDDDPNLHTRKSWLEMRNLLFHKWGDQDLEKIMNRKRLTQRLRPQDLAQEFLLYPFFWQGMPGIKARMAFVQSPNFSLRARFRKIAAHTYDRLILVPVLWTARCWLLTRLRCDDDYEKRRLRQIDESKYSAL